MKRILITLFTFFTIASCYSQALYKTFYSSILNEEREIKVLLPRGYSNDGKKSYPVVYVFDGDYLFEPVVGNADMYAYWENIPNSIIVGINQSKTRSKDLEYSGQSSLPIGNGAKFFEFVGKELVPYINKNYKTEDFRVAVGHGETANFINYFLVREIPLFNAYIVMSPDFADDMPGYIAQRLETVESKIFYFLSTTTNDIPFIKEGVTEFNQKLLDVGNPNFIYGFNDSGTSDHYTSPAHIIPKAFEHIFHDFRPISKKEFNESIMTLTTSPVDYLKEKYEGIEVLFGLKKQIIINDFKAIEAYIKKKEKWEYLEDLAKLAETEYPDTLLFCYYKGMFYEKSGAPRKAIKVYKDAYILQEVGGITKDQLLNKAEDISIELSNK